METKADIRKHALQERAALPKIQQKIFSQQIVENLLKHPLYHKSEEIYCYVSFHAEVDTHQLIKVALMQGKKVAVPKIMNPQSLEFFYINSLADLFPSSFGIMEPDETRPARASESLVLLPGVAFDKQGGRIGYGKGFYDRYLADYQTNRRIGLAYEQQLYPQLPVDTYDIPLEYIITEKEIYTC